ncbi:hypothetical protein ABIC45_001238 [Mucilaginibacter rubeus]|uniref:hypothetical protein n=1 Tax=Mucilaginibacter rubeus TaxID=2027860 RepID=UPI003394337A
MDSEFVFDYGDTKETFDERGYKVPVTRNVWVAGNNLAPVLIIVHSVMEAVAMLSLNFQRFSGLDNPGRRCFGQQAMCCANKLDKPGFSGTESYFSVWQRPRRPGD